MMGCSTRRNDRPNAVWATCHETEKHLFKPCRSRIKPKKERNPGKARYIETLDARNRRQICPKRGPGRPKMAPKNDTGGPKWLPKWLNDHRDGHSVFRSACPCAPATLLGPKSDSKMVPGGAQEAPYWPSWHQNRVITTKIIR